MVVRQLVSIAILPFAVTVLVPVFIARANRMAFVAPPGGRGWRLRPPDRNAARGGAAPRVPLFAGFSLPLDELFAE